VWPDSFTLIDTADVGLDLGRQILTQNRVDSVWTMCEKIDAVTIKVCSSSSSDMCHLA
jgi:hypothetical protein